MRWSVAPTTISSGVGLIRSMYTPGSYSVSISTERSVTSLRHDGAIVRPASVNQWNESGVGSAEPHRAGRR